MPLSTQYSVNCKNQFYFHPDIQCSLTGVVRSVIGGTIWWRTISLSAASAPHHSWAVRQRLSTGFPFLPNMECWSALRYLTLSGPATLTVTIIIIILLLLLLIL